MHIYDPKVRHSDIKALYEGVVCHDDPYEAAKGAHAILVLTDWQEVGVFFFFFVFFFVFFFSPSNITPFNSLSFFSSPSSTTRISTTI